MPTQDPTVNYNWNLPTEGGDVGAWGGLLNAIFGDDATGIDPIVKGISNVANAALPKAGGTMTGNLIATDNLYDIGASGATRFRDLFLSRNFVAGGTAAITGAVTGGTYNGQTISAAASFTGSMSIAGNVTAENGVVSAGGANTDLTLSAIGAGGAFVAKTNATNRLTISAAGAIALLGATTASSTFAATGLITATAGLSASAAVYQISTTGTAKIQSIGDSSQDFVTQNSKILSVSFAGVGYLYLIAVTFSSGKACLFGANYDSATITAITPLPSSMVLSSTPATAELGVYKSAASEVVSLKSGATLATASARISVSSIGRPATISDWT